MAAAALLSAAVLGFSAWLCTYSRIVVIFGMSLYFTLVNRYRIFVFVADLLLILVLRGDEHTT